jgi:hypothetical protein
LHRVASECKQAHHSEGQIKVKGLMATRLTDHFVKHTKYDHAAGKVNDITWDTLAPGLGLKVTKAGRKTWLVQLRPPARALSRGACSGLTLASHWKLRVSVPASGPTWCAKDRIP